MSLVRPANARPAHTRPAHKRTRARGQSLVEFAIVLPILLGLFGATLDFARVHEVRQKLTAATRDAAEYAATNATSSTDALTQGRSVVCAQFGQPSCTSPAIAVTSFSRNTTIPPGTAAYPQVSVTVSSSMPYQTLFPYPFLTDRGATTLSVTSSYVVLQGR
jgi:Flp pilus assembly protein TadG